MTPDRHPLPWKRSPGRLGRVDVPAGDTFFLRGSRCRWAGAHQKDLEVQGKHGVKYLRYWYNEDSGKVYCLVDAPSKEAAETVHREAHGLLADEITEVKEGS